MATTIRAMMPTVRMLHPVTNFKRVFKKDIDQQWDIARMMFVQLVIQVIQMTLFYQVSQDIRHRMVLEDSESRLAYVFLMLHLVTWFLLVTERRKKFALPRIFGYLTLNIYLFTFFFLQCLQVSMRNASMVYVYGWFILNDYFFGYMYVMLSNYISPTGFWFFCFFPKVFLAVSCYFYYDDRACEIIQCMVISSVTCMVNGLTAEGLLLNCEQDQIVEFSLPDYYILQYLDLPYIAYQSYLGAAAIVEETRAKLFDVKGKSKVDESSDAKEKKE